MITLAIVNRSSAVSDAQLSPVVKALQRQVSEHFYPGWGIGALLLQVGKNEKPPARAWQMIIADNSDAAGAMGYHDVTAEGLPLGKAFILPDVRANRPWTTTISHEVLEILANPDISTAVEHAGSLKTIWLAREVCDPCQDDKWAYTIDGVLVSDFVYPGWYHTYRNYPWYDYAKHIKEPLQILEGGYQSVYDHSTGKGWQEINSRGVPPVLEHNARALVGSRRERRHLSKSQWLTSQES